MNKNRAGSQRKTTSSARGVAYRLSDDGIEIVLCGRASDGLWALPEGSPSGGESPVDTALREVREETGLRVAVPVEEALHAIRYPNESDIVRSAVGLIQSKARR